MAAPKGNLKVVLEGRGPLTLREVNYITSGGEGSVYKANATVVKIYTDPAKMQRDGMADKIKLLAKLTHPSIIAPQGVVLDEKSATPIGFYMPWVEGEPLSRVFVTDFRTRVGFGEKETHILVDRMRETVTYAHGTQALMVDANELNWLVDLSSKKDGPTPKVIDVDSWAVGKWPAMVIMPSIRDWHAKTFSQKTDWFAWGVVTFQVYTGIHPYKGRLDGYKPGQLAERMKANASVFSPNVRLPHAVRDFNTIPGPLLDWYQATFQQGERTVPPSPFDTRKAAKAAQVLRMATNNTATGSLIFEKLFGRTNNPVVRIWPNGAVWLQNGEVVDISTNQTIGNLSSSNAEVVKTIQGWLLADVQNGIPLFTYNNGQTTETLSFNLAFNRLFRAGNRLFAVTDTELMELELHVLGKPLLLVGKKRYSIRPNAMRWFDDVAVANMLGATFLYLPQPDGAMVQLRVKELDGLIPIAAKAGNRFVALTVADKNGDYHKLELTLDKTSTSYTFWQAAVDSPELNMAPLPQGPVATIVNDGELVIFVPINGQQNKVQDRGITTALHLQPLDTRVVYINNGDIWRIRVK